MCTRAYQVCSSHSVTVVEAPALIHNMALCSLQVCMQCASAFQEYVVHLYESEIPLECDLTLLDRTPLHSCCLWGRGRGRGEGIEGGAESQG